MKTMVVGTLRPKKAQAARLYRKEVAPVGVVEMGVAFTLFRAAVLDEFGQSPSPPLTDDFVKACFSKQAYQRGMLILAIHFDHPDIPNAFMRRLDSFVRLLQNVGESTWRRCPRPLSKAQHLRTTPPRNLLVSGRTRAAVSDSRLRSYRGRSTSSDLLRSECTQTELV